MELQVNECEIFISHAGSDKELADALMDLLTTTTKLSADMIFCSSLEGMGIPKGMNFIEFIKRNIMKPKLVIVLLTPNYYDSIFCNCELGASWALSHDIFPLLVPPLTYKDLVAVLENVQAGIIDNESDLNDLRDKINNLLNDNKNSTARWERKRNQFLSKLKEILPVLPKPSRVDYKKFDELKNKYEDSLDEQERLDSEIERLEEIIEGLKKCKDREAVKDILIANSTQWDAFEQLARGAYNNIRELPSIVREAIYYSISRKNFIIKPNDQEKWEEAREASENDYLTIDEDSIEVNGDDSAVDKARVSVLKVVKFLDETSEEFSEQYQEENGFKPNIKSRRFWNEQVWL